jgi:hypothetical protein
MNIAEYFKHAKGRGMLATADGEGKVDAAIYASPHIFDDGTIAFIMRDRLTHHNLQSNPHAAYLFMEEGRGFKGVRLFLTKTAEERDTERLFSLRRKSYEESAEHRGPLFLVTFKVDKVLPLVGAGSETDSD